MEHSELLREFIERVNQVRCITDRAFDNAVSHLEKFEEISALYSPSPCVTFIFRGVCLGVMIPYGTSYNLNQLHSWQKQTLEKCINKALEDTNTTKIFWVPFWDNSKIISK